jgi:hypothetical protein
MPNIGAGINSAIAGLAGAPVDLVTGLLNNSRKGLGVPEGQGIPEIRNPVGGSASIMNLLGGIGADPREISATTRPEQIARAVGTGIGSAVLPGMAARALPMAAGPVASAIQKAIASGAQPGAATLAGVAGGVGNVAEEYAPEPLKPLANTTAQLATGVGAGLAQRGGRSMVDAMLGVGNVAPDRAAFARRLIDQYDIPLTAPDIQPYGAPVKWLQTGLDYLPMSGAAARQGKLQDAVGRALSKDIGGDAAGQPASRLTYDVAEGAMGRIGGQYESALSNVRVPFKAPAQFQDIRVKIAESTLAANEQRALGGLMRNIERVARQNGGVLTGREYQEFRMRGSQLNSLINDSNPAVSRIARDVKGVLDDAFMSAAPKENAALYGLSNQQYRTLMALRPEITKGEPGRLTLGNLQAAANRRAPNRAFSGENDTLGDLGDAAKTFLQRMPESGTAPRAGVLGMLQSLARGEFGPAAGYGVAGGTAAGAGPVGLAGLVLGGRLANQAINSPRVRDSLLRRVLDPPPPPPIVPPWMAGALPAQLDRNEAR